MSRNAIAAHDPEEQIFLLLCLKKEAHYFF
jgi:hypothetical protein